MKKYSKIMTALDLSEFDNLLVPFTYQMATWLQSKTIYGAHVIPVILIPNLVKLDPANNFMPVAPAVEKIREKAFNEIKTVVGDSDLSIRIKIEEGRPYHKLLEIVKEAKPDLLIFGKKEKTEGSGITTSRIARNIDADILVIPELAKLEIKKILLPMDFSENSYRALQFVQGLQKAMGINTKIDAIQVVDISHQQRYEKHAVYNDLNELLPKNAKEQYQNFLRHYGVDEDVLNMKYVKTEKKNIANTVLDYANEYQYDFIVVGAKGHSLFENFAFGSVTETLMDMSKKNPIMVVR